MVPIMIGNDSDHYTHCLSDLSNHSLLLIWGNKVHDNIVIVNLVVEYWDMWVFYPDDVGHLPNWVDSNLALFIY